jgi:glycosyltransferase involved in cell wall biosynthesis
MISIVVPAHNESSVIARTLSQCVTNPASDETAVVFVGNGCTDDNANVARRFGPTAHVVESDIASKAHALKVGDQRDETSRAALSDSIQRGRNSVGRRVKK